MTGLAIQYTGWTMRATTQGLMLFCSYRRALASNELGEHERAGRQYRDGNLFADSRLTDVRENCVVNALRLSLIVPRGGYLGAALEETTV